MLVLESLEKAEVEVADELLGEAFLLCMRYLHTWSSDTPKHTLWLCPRHLAAQLSPCSKCPMGKSFLGAAWLEGWRRDAPGLCTPACYLPTCPGLPPLWASSLL